MRQDLGLADAEIARLMEQKILEQFTFPQEATA